jgi:peptidyl-prolyl cis-trans isomerase B (cyclophilin B)
MAGGQPSRPKVSRVVAGMVSVGLALAAAACSTATSQPRPGETGAPARTSAGTCAPPPVGPSTYPTFATPPPASVALGSGWSAVLHTTCGDVSLVLDGKRAPRSVASFVTLARSGYWSPSVCHRLTSAPAPTAFLQCGDPTGRSTADPGYGLPLEHVPDDRTYRVGDVGVARGDGFPSTSGEFFIVHHAFTVASGSPVYSLIGRVTSGLAVVEHVAAVGGEDFRDDGPPWQSISILSVDVQPR